MARKKKATKKAAVKPPRKAPAAPKPAPVVETPEPAMEWYDDGGNEGLKQRPVSKD